MFYWEHRIGSWQAQSQLEWDTVQEVFSPFNSRELIEIMLSVDSSKRKSKRPLLYLDSISYLWKELLDVPINPVTIKTKLKKILSYLKMLIPINSK